jgi:1-deoxy-D-xylulose-5-phosphate reductoisomerase
MKKICILGSTGSIGRQALDVVRHLSGALKISALTAHSNLRMLKTQISEFRPEAASIWSEDSANELRAWCRAKGFRTSISSGEAGLIEAVECGSSRLVLSSVVGSAGLRPLMAAIRLGKDIALANKEALVIAGSIVMSEAKRRGSAILPVDSEHSAIFQCLKNEDPGSVRRIFLTASGGPFYRSRIKPSKITVKDALAHPTWDMGPKVTVDSATLMNKGLEAIEAHHLFGVKLENIQIVIHPQSIVHSMVEFIDSSVIAQLSNPDMRLPIQYALTYPLRLRSSVKKLDLAKIGSLDFSSPDFGRFPCLRLALAAAKEGGTMPAAMNAANEVAVGLFLRGKLSFAGIPILIRKTMDRHVKKNTPSIEHILAADSWARSAAAAIAAKI